MKVNMIAVLVLVGFAFGAVRSLGTIMEQIIRNG